MSDLNLTLNDTEKYNQCINLLQMLERFFTVAAFYPSIHNQCQNALLDLHKAIDLVVPINEAIILAPGDNGIIIQGTLIKEINNGQQSLNNLLNSLGITQLELPHSAPLEIIHQTVRNLNILKLKVDSPLEFHSMDFSSLPPIVKVNQREFRNNDQTIQQDKPVLKRNGNQKSDKLNKGTIHEIYGHDSIPQIDSAPGINPIQPQLDTTQYSLSLNDLKTKIYQNDARADLMDLSNKDNSIEMLYVCLQIIRQRSIQLSSSPNCLVSKHLNKILESPIDSEKARILESTITHLISSADRQPIDKLLPWLITPLMHNDNKRFIFFLDHLVPEYQPEKLALIWPHLVGIMLQPKQPSSKNTAQTILSLIGKISEEARQTEAHRLDLLPVVQTGKFGPGLFHADLQQSHQALLSLMDCRQSQTTGQLLNRCWQNSPPSSLVSIMIRIFGPYDKGHRSLYRSLLKSGSVNGLDNSLKSEFSKLINSFLMGLAPDSRKESWVAQAISELGALQCPESLPPLEKILSQKKIIIFNSWPDACRKAALKAAEQIQNKKAGQ